MARYDKIDPYNGVHRAPLAADWVSGDIGKPYAVGLNNAGKVVKGKGNQPFPRYVLILTKVKKANQMVDLVNIGELADFAPTAGVPEVDFGTPGTDYFGHGTTGAISATATDGCSYVGTTVEGSRLILAVSPHVLAVDVP